MIPTQLGSFISVAYVTAFSVWHIIRQKQLENIMGHFTLAGLILSSENSEPILSWSWAEPSVSTRFSSEFQWRLGISDPSCKMFILMARLGLGFESEPSPWLRSDSKPILSWATSVNMLQLGSEIPSLHWKSELNLVTLKTQLRLSSGFSEPSQCEMP